MIYRLLHARAIRSANETTQLIVESPRSESEAAHKVAEMPAQLIEPVKNNRSTDAKVAEVPEQLIAPALLHARAIRSETSSIN